MPDEKPLKLNIILAGGGVRFGAFIGALHALRERGVVIRKIVGISGGSIISTLHASGYSLDDLKTLMLEMDYRKFKDFSPLSCLAGTGLYSGKHFESWIDGELGGKRFGDSFHLDHYVVATDLLRGKPMVFSKATFPELKVSRAVRFSIGIPLFYAYQKFHISPGDFGIMVDGNLSSFAMGNIFHDDAYSTLTLRIATSKTFTESMPKGFNRFSYPRQLVKILMNSLEKERVSGERWRKSLLLFSGDITSTKFDLSTEEKHYLFEEGYRQVMENLDKKTL
jgi:NTE family protein